MSVEAETTSKAYAKLAELELEFDQAEAELLKHQIALFEPLYTRRNAVLATIPTFWTVVFENFGPELDEHITTDDWAFLGENLSSLNVTRPDATNNPRSFEITFGFKEGNGVVDGTEIKKKFTYKSLIHDGERWSGLISEPVEIKWVSDKADLTGGINKLAIKIFDIRKKRLEQRIEDKKNAEQGKSKESGKTQEDDGLSELELELEEKLNQTQSFFNWLSWSGEYFLAVEEEAEAQLKEIKSEKGEESDKGKGGGDDDDTAIDIFPDGEKLAYLFAEDMFPDALKRFTDAMESNEVAGADSEGEDGVDYDDEESIELDSDLEEQLMKGNLRGKSNKLGGKKKRKSDDEMEDEDEEQARDKKKARN